MNKIKSIFSILFPIFLGLVSNELLAQGKSSQNKINFLYLKMFYDQGANENKIELVQKDKKDKSSKSNLKDEYVSNNYLIVEFYEDNVLTKTFNIAHPLYKSQEFFDGIRFQRVGNDLKEDTFVLKVPSKKNVNQVIIYEKIDNQPRVQKITLDL